MNASILLSAIITRIRRAPQSRYVHDSSSPARLTYCPYDYAGSMDLSRLWNCYIWAGQPGTYYCYTHRRCSVVDGYRFYSTSPCSFFRTPRCAACCWNNACVSADVSCGRRVKLHALFAFVWRKRAVQELNAERARLHYRCEQRFERVVCAICRFASRRNLARVVRPGCKLAVWRVVEYCKRQCNQHFSCGNVACEHWHHHRICACYCVLGIG